MYLFTLFTYYQFFSWILYHTHTDIVIHQGTSCWASSSGGAQELLKVLIFCRNLSAFRGPIAKVFQTITFCQQCAGYARSPNDCHTCKWAVDGVKKTKTHEKMWWGGYNCSYHICRKQSATRECCKACTGTAMKAKTAKVESCKSSCSGETSNSSGVHCNFLASAPSFLFCARSSWIFTSHRSQ